MKSRTLSMLSLAALAFLVVGAGGCIFSPDSDDGGPGTGPGPDPYPFAGTEDQLMANFKTAYDEMDRNVYVDDVLYDEFHFVFTEGSPYAPAGGWDRGAEVESVTSMFAGNAGWDEVAGVSKAGVQDISFSQLLRLNDWEDVPLNDPVFPGARKALYDVEIVFYLDTGSNTITVAGQQLFYVMSEQVEVDGVMKTRWRLFGQTDLSADGKANEAMTWSIVKVLYR